MKPEIKDLYEKRAKSFLEFYGTIDKYTLTTFLGITPDEYHRIRKQMRLQHEKKTV